MNVPYTASTVMPDFPVTSENVIQFWADAGPAAWFAKNEVFDAEFRERFLGTHMAAARRELDHWADTPRGTLALLILLDQFPRNAFRGTGHMFATDSLALHFARLAKERHFIEAIDASLRAFMILPFEHSESLDDQHIAVALCEPLGGSTFDFAVLHREIIQRFGRFPHRNAALGRISTQAELDYLASGGFKG